MLLAACILWLGFRMSAPVWFYVLLGIFAMIKMFAYGQAFAKVINKIDKEDKE